MLNLICLIISIAWWLVALPTFGYMLTAYRPMKAEGEWRWHLAIAFSIAWPLFWFHWLRAGRS
jgi:hypothetical protein